MRVAFTARQLQRQSRFRAFADRYVVPNAGVFDRNEALDRDLVRRMATAGFLGSHLPTRYGGRHLDMISYGLLHRELGRGCSSTRSLLTVHDMVGEAILRLGGTQLRETWLPRLTAGEQLGAFALTEPTAGSDAGSIQTTATQDGADYVINGTKKWISFAQLADVFLVVARIGP